MIVRGRKKFKEFKEYPCSLVLRNNGKAFVDLQSPDIILASMYGNAGLNFPVDTKSGKTAGPVKGAFLVGSGKMIRPHRHENTTINALITLRYVDVGVRQYRTAAKKYPASIWKKLLRQQPRTFRISTSEKSSWV